MGNDKKAGMKPLGSVLIIIAKSLSKQISI